jgi:phthalate 4,5-dioxygenase oxygenase subunit
VRSTVFVAPATTLIPPNNLYNVANINVPMDDTHTAFYFIAWGHPAKVPDTETWRKFLGARIGVDLDDQYNPLRTKENRFWQDREAMKAGNFTGIVGFPNQDIAMWITMGPIANRTDDRLGASDMAIVEFRRQMLDAVLDFQAGKPAIGTGANGIPPEVCSFQAIVPKTIDWRNFDAVPVWTDDATAPRLETNYQTTA